MRERARTTAWWSSGWTKSCGGRPTISSGAWPISSLDAGETYVMRPSAPNARIVSVALSASRRWRSSAARSSVSTRSRSAACRSSSRDALRSRWSACSARIPSATVSSMPATGTPQWSTASIVATSVAIAARTVPNSAGTLRRRRCISRRPPARHGSWISLPASRRPYRQSADAPVAVGVQARGGGSVLEVATACEDHRDTGRVGGGDHLGVPHRPARLDDRADARIDRELRTVGEGEEGVGGHRGALHGSLLRLLQGDSHGVDAAHLAGADADGRATSRQHDCVGADVLADAPREQQLAPLGVGRLPLRRDRHLGALLRVEVAVLHEQAAHDLLEVGVREMQRLLLVVLEDPQVRSARERLERDVVVAGREQHLGELLHECL